MRRLESLAADSTTLHAYLQEITKFPRLTIDQERELGRRIHEQHDTGALNALVEGNLRFVVSYTRRYRQLGVPFLDLIHEGNLGLIEAARHFGPDCPVRFITHGMWWIRQSIMRRLAAAPASALRAQFEHQPPAPDAADDLGIVEPDAQILVRSLGGDAPLHVLYGGEPDPAAPQEFDEALQDQAIREVDDDTTRDALVRELELALNELSPRERLIMRLRFGLYDDEAWTLQQIGERMQLPIRRVRRIETRATQKLARQQHLRGCLN